MHERDGIRLMQYLDGTLAPAERKVVEAWISVDPEARRLAGEHRALWQLLGETDLAAAPPASPEFRRRTLQRASEPARAARQPRLAALIATSLLVGVIVFAWHDAATRVTIDDADLAVVGNLDLIEHLEFLEAHARSLDNAVNASVLHEFPAVSPSNEPVAPGPDAAGADR